ncbi:MAG: flagellar biosynthesis protein FliQ [Acetobacteraceae bacterium]
MNSADVAALMRDSMVVTLKLGGPLLAVGLVAGALISLLQAVTQVHEATLAFVPKMLAIGVTLILLGPFMTQTLIAYAHLLFDRIITIGIS